MKGKIATFLSLLFLLGITMPFARSLENGLLDFRYRMTELSGLSPDLSEDIVLVELDQITVESLGSITPFPREYLARVVSRLDSLGAGLIALDIILDKPTDPKSDSLLAASISKVERILLPGVIEYRGDTTLFQEPLPMFRTESYIPCFVNIPRQSSVKYVVLNAEIGDRQLPFIAKAIADIYGKAASMKKLYLSYVSPSFRGYPAHLLFSDPPADYFEGKIVIVGATFDNATDSHFRTPFLRGLFSVDKPNFPGVLIILNATNTLFLGLSPGEIPNSIILPTSFILAILAYVMLLRAASIRWGLAVFPVILMILAIAQYLFTFHRLILNVTYLSFGLLAGVLLASAQIYFATRNRATKDKNTGLFNRQYMQGYLERELRRARRRRKPLCAMFIDIDHFKAFNDNYGHDTGDIVLKSISEIILKEVNNRGIGVRLGGDELLVILPNTDIDQARQIAEKIAKATKAIEIQSTTGSVSTITLSIGIAGGKELPDTPSQLLKQADMAMYRAKEGRDSIAE